VWSVRELSELLIAPDAGEWLSPLDGPGTLALDLGPGASAISSRDRERLLEELPLLPCVTVALFEGPGDPRVRALAAACDVTVPDRAALESLGAGFGHTPVAALAFVQLLRGAPRRSIHEALIAESFVYSTLQAGAEFRAWLAERRARAGKPAIDEGPACRLERDRGRLDIRLTRSRKHNAFSRGMRDELTEALQLAISDPSIEEVVLSGEGESFCSGGDLDEFGSFPDPAEAHVIRTTRSPALLISKLSGRIRAEVHGACIGAGAELPAFTDHVVAGEDAFFCLPEVGLGLVPGAGGTASLPRRIGRQRTAWLGLSGARIDAATALAWGLVDEVRLIQPAARMEWEETRRS
jgi:enoyl-CoA hydratase/carnithine racemase